MYGLFEVGRGSLIRFHPDKSFSTIIEAGCYLGNLHEYEDFYVEMDEENDAADILTNFGQFTIERLK